MGAARQVGGVGRSLSVSGNELDGFVSESPPSLLAAVPAYPRNAIPDDSIEDDEIDDAVVLFSPPQPKSRPFRNLASALWGATCAVAYAPVALVVFVATRIWWFGSWVVRGIWRGITGVVVFVTSIMRACAHATARAIAATARFCVAVARAIAYAPVALVLFILALLRSIVDACVRAVVRTVVATGALCVAVANAVAGGVKAIGAGCAFVAHAVAAGALASVTAIVSASVYAVVWVVVVARTLCVLGAKAIRAGVHATRSCVRLIGAGIALASRHFATSVRTSASAAARAGEAGAERAILAGSRSVARSTTAMASGVSALRSGTQGAAASTVRRAQAAGETWLTAVSDGVHGLRARVAAFRVRVTPRVAVASTDPAEGAWSRRTVVAPAIGAVLLAAAATASTVLVISRLPGAPQRPVSEGGAAAAIAPLSTPPASVAPTVTRPTARPAVTRPAIAPVNVSGAASDVSTRSIDVKKMRALWLKADTRSLDRALSTVRQSTLAFKSCNVQVTKADQAVAHCELASTGGTASRKTEWTIDFSRSDDRWSIDGITEASSGRPRR